jgi:hypothetical protein
MVMRKTILLFAGILLFTSLKTFAQTLEKDKIDKFTKNEIKATSWEKLIGKGGMSSLFTNFRISKVNETIWFELKMMMNNKIYSINQNNQIIFLFENEETLVLVNNEFAVACKGCGAPGYVGSEGYGTHTYYLLNNDQIEILKKNIIKSVRIYNSETYVEGDAEKVNKTLLKCFELIGK